MRWLLPAVSLLAVSCSLPAAILPGANVVADGAVGGGVLRVKLPTSALPNCSSVDECTLLKAAEVTQRAGGTHFVVLPGHGGPTQRGYAYIKVLTLGAYDIAPSGAMSVEEALNFIRKPPQPNERI
jgi:hypothetical protein